MKQKFKYLILVLIILPCCLMFGGCASIIYVTNIQKTQDLGSSSVYTIYYSDGSIGTITIEDGQDGKDIDVMDLFQAGVSLGIYTNDTNGFKQFLSDLNVQNPNTSANVGFYKATHSAVIIHANGGTGSTGSAGSGVIYKMDSNYTYIVTNYHVTHKSMLSTNVYKNIAIYLYGSNIIETNYVQMGGDAIMCTYLGGSAEYDLAVLRAPTSAVKAINEYAQPVEICSSYEESEEVFAIGNPEGDGFSVTNGIVSKHSCRLSMDINGDDETDFDYRVLQTNTDINGGNSGGGLFNKNGQLVGIVNAKQVWDSEDFDANPIEGIGFALPFDNVTKVVENILYNYERLAQSTTVQKVLLGIKSYAANVRTITNPTTLRQECVSDTVIASKTQFTISEESIAHKIGLTYGDKLTAIKIQKAGEQTVAEYQLTKYYQLDELLLTLHAGDSFQINYVRQGNAVEQSSGTHTVQVEDFVSIR